MKSEVRKLQVKALENAYHPFEPNQIYDAEILKDSKDYLDVQVVFKQGVFWFPIFPQSSFSLGCTLYPPWIQKYWEHFGNLPSEETVKAFEK